VRFKAERIGGEAAAATTAAVIGAGVGWAGDVVGAPVADTWKVEDVVFAEAVTRCCCVDVLMVGGRAMVGAGVAGGGMTGTLRFVISVSESSESEYASKKRFCGGLNRLTW
jgi:hypothetical protein